MKKTIFVILPLLAFSTLFYIIPQNVSSSTASGHTIHVCADISCQDCPCLACSYTFTLYHSNGAPTNYSCTTAGISVCCDIKVNDTLPDGHYYFILQNNCHTCPGDTFTYSHSDLNDTVNCTNCSTDRKSIKNIQLPNVYSLAQNYPNPFNPSTTISYSLPQDGLIKLVVYDMLGRIVSTLVNGRKEAGTYSVDFDASNLASGMYFYEIKANNFTEVKKMLLIK